MTAADRRWYRRSRIDADGVPGFGWLWLARTVQGNPAALAAIGPPGAVTGSRTSLAAEVEVRPGGATFVRLDRALLAEMKPEEG